MVDDLLVIDAPPGVDPDPAQGLRGSIGASAGVPITAPVAVRITVIDIARTDMRRVMTAPEVVGPIIGAVAWSDRQVGPWAATTILDLNQTIPGAFTGLQKRLPGRCRVGHWNKPPQTDGQQTSHQDGCEQIPTTHEPPSRPRISSGSLCRRHEVSPLAMLCAGTDSRRHEIAGWQRNSITR